MIIEAFGPADVIDDIFLGCGDPYYDDDAGLKQQYVVEYSTCFHLGQYQFVFCAKTEPIYSTNLVVHYKLESNGNAIAQEQVSVSYPEDCQGIEVTNGFDIPLDIIHTQAYTISSFNTANNYSISIVVDMFNLSSDTRIYP